MRTKFKSAAAIFVIFALLYAAGYMFFFSSVGFVSDDFSGFVQISGKDHFKAIYESLATWRQGRPIGHALWRLQHLLFSPFPTGVYQLWCGALIVIQSVVGYRVLRRLSIAKAPAIFAASALGLAPFAQSVYLPVHAGFTEFATTLFLVSMLYACDRKPIYAAVCAAFSLLFYEQMVILFWAPAAVLLWRSRCEIFPDRTVGSVRGLASPLKYIAITAVLVGLIFWLRSVFGSGRENELGDYTMIELWQRAHHAGMVGARTSLRIFDWAQRFNQSVNAPTIGIAMFGSAIGAGVILAAFRRDLSEAPPTNILFMVFLFILGVLLFWLTHIVFITPERYPPGIMTGRLTNTHSAARFGLALGMASLLNMLLVSRFYLLRAAGVAFGWAILCWMLMYSHSYGAAASHVWSKKIELARAHGAACVIAPSFQNSVVILPEGFLDTNTDPVVDWTTHMTPAVFFRNSGKTRIFVVLSDKEEEFLRRFGEEGVTIDLSAFTGTGFSYVLRRTPNRLVVSKTETVVLKLDKAGTLSVVSAPENLTRKEAGSCVFEPRMRFENLQLMPQVSGEAGPVVIQSGR